MTHRHTNSNHDQLVINATDADWEHFGATEPYWAVLTDEKFKLAQLTPETIEEFYDSGEGQVTWILGKVRDHIDQAFEPRSGLDFGCGVGRLAIPLARRCPKVAGVDVSLSMLAKARARCETCGIANLSLIQGDDALSGLEGPFDLITSVIVLQHIPIFRGERLSARMIELLGDRGVGALHLTYSKSWYDPKWMHNKGIRYHWRELRAALWRKMAGGGAPAEEDRRRATEIAPYMQMNDYQLNRIFHNLQKSGVRRLHVEFTDHGGAYGVFLFFQKDAQGHYEA
jgi:SAM-dependent methyltransferase